MHHRIAIINGHPAPNSLTASLIGNYIKGAKKAGHEVREISVRDLHFDPILRDGYKSKQALETDLKTSQAAIKWADHLVFVFPNWWGGMPAQLKGFIERTFLPGFAFKYRKDSLFWDKYLTGKSARIVMTMDTPPWYHRWIQWMPGVRQLKRNILAFCGIKPVRTTLLGSVKRASDSKINRWLDKMYRLGMKAK